jgi:uncharacterized glyoxalase superfamily protein PhnB
MSYTAAHSSPVAVSLRVADVRRAAAFYQQIGFHQVMAVPDESDEWLLCLLRFGNASILLGALDSQRFPRGSGRRYSSNGAREPRAHVAVDIADVTSTYAACVRASCRITRELAHGIRGGYGFTCVDPFGYGWEFTQAAGSPGIQQHGEGYDDRMALACQCGAIAALIQ